MNSDLFPASARTLLSLYDKTFNIPTEPGQDDSLLRATQFELAAAIVEAAEYEHVLNSESWGNRLVGLVAAKSVSSGIGRHPGIWVQSGTNKRPMLRKVAEGLAGEVTVSFPTGSNKAYVVMDGDCVVGLSNVGRANLAAGLNALNIK